MKRVTLKNQTATGIPLEATFLPENGMNMISYKKGDIEVIDQSTLSLFEERNAGLGALIGPHFHRRNSKTLPPVPHEERFLHIARLKEKGELKDPFSHGIGRYAPWRYEADETSIKASLNGEESWNGVPLKELEGQPFTLEYKATLTSEGLEIDYSVVSLNDSVVGLHYYYHLPEKKGSVISQVDNQTIINGKREAIPENFGYELATCKLHYNLDKETDFTFFPKPDPLHGKITLDALRHRLTVSYRCLSQENSWQLYHPKGASFVCIEPISAQDPRHPNLTASSLSIKIEIDS